MPREILLGLLGIPVEHPSASEGPRELLLIDAEAQSPSSALLVADRLWLRGERVDGRARRGARPAARGEGRGADVAGDGVVGEDLRLDLAGHVGVLAQELLGVLAPLADAIAGEAEPGAGLLDGAALGAEVDEIPLVADPLAVEDVELHLAERRGHLVLHHLDARPV